MTHCGAGALSTLYFRLPILTSRCSTCGVEITSRYVSGSRENYLPGRVSMPARPRGTDILIGRLCCSTSETQLQRITSSMTLSLSWLWKRMGLNHSEHIPGAPRPAATGPRPRRRWTQRAAPRRASRWTHRALRVALDTPRLALDTPRLARSAGHNAPRAGHTAPRAGHTAPAGGAAGRPFTQHVHRQCSKERPPSFHGRRKKVTQIPDPRSASVRSHFGSNPFSQTCWVKPLA